MDFRPSPAQQLLVATARDFLRRHCPIETSRAGFDPKLWRAMAELGWPGLLVPADLGGSDGSLADVILLVEELGHAVVPGPYVASAVAATVLLRGASASRQKRTLPAMASGDRIAVIALVEQRGSFDPGAITLACEGDRLTGRKLFVKDAHLADDLIVVLRGGALLLPAGRRGITRLPLDAISDEKLFEVVFEEVEVRDEDRLAVEPGAVSAALDAGALARTAEMVGAAQRILEMTVEHAKTRVQGGRPIGGHQAIQHACADLVRDVDTSRGLLYAAACGASDVAMAKAYAGEACLAVARRAHQIFGAISYCDEHPLHFIHKRIHAASLDFGDAALHLERVARAIGLES